MNKENFVKIFNYPLSHKMYFFNKNAKCDNVNKNLQRTLDDNIEEDLVS